MRKKTVVLGWIAAAVVAVLVTPMVVGWIASEWRYARVKDLTEVEPPARERPAPTAAKHDDSVPPPSTPASPLQAFEALKQRAQAGDVMAQRHLAEAYNGCHLFNGNHAQFLEIYESQALTMEDRAQADVMRQVARRRISACEAVEGGAKFPSRNGQDWYERAAANGDLVARAMSYAGHEQTMEGSESARLVEDVVASGDPAAVFAFGHLLSSRMRVEPGEAFGGLSAGRLSGMAWEIAACRIGYDCGPESRTVENLCLFERNCTGEGLEATLRAGLSSQEERDALDAQVDLVLRLLEAA